MHIRHHDDSVEEVPEEDGDEPVDVIVTDDEVIRVSEPNS